LHNIPIPRIDPEALPRDRSLLDPGPLAELSRSIAASGLRQPIEVWRLTTPRPPYLYGLISGYRRLAACRALGHTTIPAFLRTPDSLPQAMAVMVAENEVRTQITPWEKGRLILATVAEGHFPTPDAAILALYPAQTRQTRTRLRSFAMVVEALSETLATPERLTTARMDRLAAALRSGWEDLILATLLPLKTAGLESQWQALQPLLSESRTSLPSPMEPRPRRLLHLKQGLTIRREMTRTGWILRFTGPEARKGGLVDDVLDEVERVFGMG
jgi:ParB family transcriptional regulator, chromosome partitioning protein